jgi:hypothetical protein
MQKPFHRANAPDTQNRIDKHLSLPEIDEVVKKARVEFEIWEQQVRQEARCEVTKKGGPLSMGSIEVLLKKISEEVTHKAQEKKT